MADKSKRGMSYLGLLGRFFPKYKGNIILNILFMILSAVFSIVSFSAVIPIINMLFGVSDSAIEHLSAPASASVSDLFSYLGNNTLYFLQEKTIEHGAGYGLMLIACFIVASSLLANGCSYLAEYFRIPMRVGILRDLRKELFERVLRFPAGLLTKDNRGDLVSRMTNDVLEVEWCVSNTLDLLIEHPIPVIIYLVTMFTISPGLTLFAIALLLICALIVAAIGYSLKRIAHKGQSERGEILSKYEEAVGGLAVIRSFNAEGRMADRFDEVNEENRRTFQKMNRVLALSSPVTKVTVSTVLALLLWYGGKHILGGNFSISGATFVYFLLVFHSVINPVRGIAKASYSIRKQVASLERINKILDMEDDLMDGHDDGPLESVDVGADAPAIEFENVSFSYLEGQPILKNLSFTLEKGKSLALMGPVGAGKTSTAGLIMKFFAPEEGTVRIFGKDAGSVSSVDLRRCVGYVPQDSVLFNDTIFNNIALGADVSPSEATGKEARMEAVVEAAKKAGIHDFITSLPEGYDTIVGDRGSRLSGGQKQLIAVARAFLKDAPILILDEATSSLDPESSSMVIKAAADLMKSRSTLIITHREDIASMADSVVSLGGPTPSDI
jgi:ABC-type multidrug transport system fused ATPase/permease subunit